MLRRLLLFTVLIVSMSLVPPLAADAQSADEPVVQAVLFYSPTCPHCHTVIKELLVPMIEEYGDQLQVIGIDTSQPDGSQLYQTAIEHYEIPPERRGVPTLIIQDTVLVGSGEIPAEFPKLVEEGLAAGGISWPNIPGFQPELVPEEQPDPPTEEESPASSPAEAEAEQTLPTVPATEAATAEPEQTLPTVPATEAAQAETEVIPTIEPEIAAAPTAGADPSILAIDEETAVSTEAPGPPPDPVGMGLALAVLLGMVIAFLYTAWRVTMGQPLQLLSSHISATYASTWIIPILSLLGLGVSIYLAYVEVNQVEAVCGPVGHCNIVQTSPYARILGIPIALLGIVNYIAIIGLWVGQKIKPLANLSALGLLALTMFGTLFSIYLTLLEIYVIRAVCAWCLSSAVITTILMLLVAMPVTQKSGWQRAASH